MAAVSRVNEIMWHRADRCYADSFTWKVLHSRPDVPDVKVPANSSIPGRGIDQKLARELSFHFVGMVTRSTRRIQYKAISALQLKDPECMTVDDAASIFDAQ